LFAELHVQSGENRHLFAAIFGVIIILIPLRGHGASFLPTHMVARSAGYLGMVGLGVEYLWGYENFTVGLIYGYTPAWAAGVSVHSLAFPIGFRPILFESRPLFRLRPYTHITPLLALSGPFHVLRVSKEPAGYYPPNRVLGVVGVGLEAASFGDKSGSVFFEASQLCTNVAARPELRLMSLSQYSFSLGVKYNLSLL